MFPNTSGPWLIILVSCVIGFVIGQWIKNRRNRVEKNNEYVAGLKRRILAEKAVQKKKDKKMNRKG
ncbi:MAG: hypothetical protein ACYDAA_06025 [Syntrophales bacterium]